MNQQEKCFMQTGNKASKKETLKPKQFLLTCVEADGKTLTPKGQKFLERYREEMSKAALNEGCLTRPGKAGSGYAQCKLRFKGEEYAAKTYNLRALFDGTVREAQDKDFSHICGRGHKGCVDPSHIILEDRKTNLDRQKCYGKTTCSNCSHHHFAVVDCPHNPKCIRDININYN